MLDSTDSKILVGIILLIALVGCVQIGKHQGFADGYTTGENRGANLQLAHDKKIVQPIYDQNSKLVSQYNQLSDNYNTLRSAVEAYVGATKYQASKPITCNTDTTFAALGDLSTTCN